MELKTECNIYHIHVIIVLQWVKPYKHYNHYIPSASQTSVSSAPYICTYKSTESNSN